MHPHMPYHRGAAELAEAGASLDSHLDTVDELLTLALQPRKEGLGGVDQYLIQKLAQSRPLDIKSAMARLCRGMQNSIKVLGCLPLSPTVVAAPRWRPFHCSPLLVRPRTKRRRVARHCL